MITKKRYPNKFSIAFLALLVCLSAFAPQLAPSNVAYAEGTDATVGVGDDNTLTLTFPEAMNPARGEVAVFDPYGIKIAAVVSSPDTPNLFTNGGTTTMVIPPAATALEAVNAGEYSLVLNYWTKAGAAPDSAPLEQQTLSFTTKDTKRPALDPLFYISTDKVTLYFDEAMGDGSLNNLDNYSVNGTAFSQIGGVSVDTISVDKSTITFNYPDAGAALPAGGATITASALQDAAGNTVLDNRSSATRRTSNTLAFATQAFDDRYFPSGRSVIALKDEHTVEMRFTSKITSVAPGAYTVQNNTSGSSFAAYTTFSSAAILPDGYTVQFKTVAPLNQPGNKYRLATAGAATQIQNVYASGRPSGNQNMWFDLKPPEVKTVAPKQGVDNVIEVVFTERIIGFDAADFVLYDGAQKLQVNQDYYVERVKPDTFEILVESSTAGAKTIDVSFPAPSQLIDEFRTHMLPSGKVYAVNLSTQVYPAVGGEAVRSIWAVNDGELVRRDDLNNPNKAGNSAWTGSKIKLFGARNEILAFQVIVESGAGGIDALSVAIPSLNQVDGPGAITYAAPAKDPTLYAGRPIQIFSQNYMHVTEKTAANFLMPTSGPGVPVDPLGLIPDQLIPENATPGKGGFPLQVLPNRNQGIWIEVYTAKDLPAGKYTGTVQVNVDGTVHNLPIELKLMDFELPDENYIDNMVYYEGVGIHRYHQPATTEEYNALKDSYRRLLHRNRLDVSEASDESVDARIAGIMNNTGWYGQNIGYFDGTAFTAENGYEGPRTGLGAHVVSLTMFGPGSDFDTVSGPNPQANAHANADKWMNFIKDTFGEGNKRTFLYMPDEPPSSQYNYIKEVSRNVKSSAGPGKDLPILVTRAYTASLASDAAGVDGPDPDNPKTNNVIDIWMAHPSGYNQSHALTQRALGNEVNAYNGERPYSGVIALDAPATDMRATMWGPPKQEMSMFYYWHINHWYHNSTLWRGLSRYQNIWLEPITFRNTSNEYINGDGVLIYPGRNTVDPTEDRGIDGPISSIRMSNMRRGIQDQQYMGMLKEQGKWDEALAIIDSVAPKVFAGNPGSELGFAQTGDAFEQARYQMAVLLAGDDMTYDSTLEGPSPVVVGESFELQVGVEAATPDFSTLDVIVKYDPTKVEFATVEDGDLVSLASGAIQSLKSPLQVLGTAVKAAEGEIRILLSTGGGESVSDGGQLFKLVGAVRADAAAGTTTVSLDDFEVAFMADSYPLEDSSLDIAVILANKTSLTAAIAAAQALHTGAAVGTSPGNYPQVAKDALAAAIAAAQGVLNNASATQPAVDAAISALTNAVATFQAAVVIDPGVNRAALTAAIGLAQSRYNSAITGGKVGQYPAEAKTTLNAAIAAANTTLYNGTANQGQVDSAASTLTAALNSFLDQVVTLVPGGKRVSVRDLSLIVQYWGVGSADGNWSEIEKADVVDGGVINIQVLAAVARMILEDWLQE